MRSFTLKHWEQHGRARIAALVSVCALILSPAARGQQGPVGDGSPGAAAPAARNQALPAEPARTAPAGPAHALEAAPSASPAPGHSPWMAPLAGLAAGLGLASLAGQLGFASGLAPVLMLLSLGGIATALVVVFASRRYRTAAGITPGLADGWQGIGGPSYAPRPRTLRIVEPRLPTVPASVPADPLRRLGARSPFGVPDDFDTPAFLASAKRSFVRLQSAWDRSDLNELVECATDEMFNALTHELRVRAGPSRTDVISLDAGLLGIETAAGEHRASVRFTGLLRVNDEDERLDEVWNLSRPVDGSGGWLLAGIQQLN